MGRGRAKAKQQKVARELKYSSHHTDLDALQRELGSSTSTATGVAGDYGYADDEDDDTSFRDKADDDGWAQAAR